MIAMMAVYALGMPTTAAPSSLNDIHNDPQIAQRHQLHELDLDPQVVEESPVLQRWLEGTPDLERDIRHDPAIRSRLRIGYSQSFSDDSSELWVGVEDVFVEGTQVSLSGSYRPSLSNDTHQSYAGEFRYYLRPLGARVNLAPVVGYRSLDTETVDISGLDVGIRLVLALSRSGASDLSISQTWVNPGGEHELGLTTLTTGYAVTQNARIATEFQIQNSPDETQHQVGVGLEWMF